MSRPPTPRRRCPRGLGRRRARPRRRGPSYAAGAASTTARRCSRTPDRHLVDAASPTASRPTLARDVRKAGGAPGVVRGPAQARQRRPTRTPRKVDALVARAVTTRPPSCGSARSTGVAGRLGGDGRTTSAGCCMRRMRSNRQVLEMMTEFWENHLNVPVNGDAQFTYRAAYGDTIREHALGQVLRPARRRDHAPGDADLPRQGRRRPKQHPNENLGRELLELPHRRRGQLHRGRRQGLGADPDRLHGRHVGDLAGALQPRGPLARAGARSWASTTRTTKKRRPGPHPRATSTTSPTTRRPPAGSPASWP